MAISAGTKPLVRSKEGIRLEGAKVGDNLTFNRFYGNADTPETFSAKDDTGALLSAEDDTFGFDFGTSPQNDLTLSFVVKGETSVSEWVSYEDGETFKRV